MSYVPSFRAISFKRPLAWKSLLFVLTLSVLPTFAQALSTPVQDNHLAEIRGQLIQNGLFGAEVAIDVDGRIALRGSYNDSQAVDAAFSIAQTVVGVKWVSPVTPENILRKDWAKKLSSFFPTTKPDRSSEAQKQSEPIRIVTTGRPGKIRQKYALVVGVGEFAEKRINRLQYATKDAGDFYNFLINTSGAGFPRANVQLLLNEQATTGAIEQALRLLKDKAQDDDLVVVYFSSHGTPPNKNGTVQVVTFDTKVTPRQKAWETSLSEDTLGEFIQGTKAKRLVMVLDTCYSNGAYRKVDNFLPVGGKSLDSEDDEGFGNSRKILASRLLGAKDLFLDEKETGGVRPTSGAASDGWGKVLISASDAGERSWESDSLRNSFFTYYFISGMSQTKDVKSAFEFAKPRVSDGVRKEKEQIQTPQVVSDQRDWAIRF